MEKETLEEAAENNYPEGDVWTVEQAVVRRLAFMNGANWEAKKSYSEEEVKELLIQRCKHFGTSVSPFDKLLLKQDLEWFEQNKKK